MDGVYSDRYSEGNRPIPRENRPEYDPFTSWRSSDSSPPIPPGLRGGTKRPEFARPTSEPFDGGKATSGQLGEGKITSYRSDERNESLGRPSEGQIKIQERSLRDAITELRTAWIELGEFLEHAESNKGKIERKKFQRFDENVDLLCDYFEDKQLVLVNVNTKEQDRIHIAVVVSFYLEDAMRNSQDLKELHLKETLVKQVKGLQRLLQRVAEKFGVMLSGLLTPKEWTLRGELSMNLFAKAGVSVEIKFGR